MVNGGIAVNIISGFLGSGKTTAIIRLLLEKTTDEPWAIIINEFGRISIDSQTLRSSSDEDNVFEISGGCICCSAKGYFQENLEKIIETGNYSRIIIEPSGLGGIEMVTDIVSANPYLKLLEVICLVDMMGIANARLQQLPIYKTQIRKADIIVLNKRDLLEDDASEEHLVKHFRALYPEKRCLVNRGEKNFWKSLIEINEQSNTEEIKFRMILAGDNLLTDDNYKVDNLIFNRDTTFSTEKLSQFFKVNQQIVRAKGHFLTEKGWVLLNFSLSGCIFEPCEVKNQSELVIITERSAFDQNRSLNEEIISTIISDLTGR